MSLCFSHGWSYSLSRQFSSGARGDGVASTAVCALPWLGETGPTLYTGFHPASRYVGRERLEAHGGDGPQVLWLNQEPDNMAGSTLPSGKGHRDPGRERPGDTQRGASERPPCPKEKMSYPHCRSSRAEGTGQKNSHRPLCTAWTPASIRPWGVRLHYFTTRDSTDYHLWWRHSHHQPTPGGWNSTDQVDPSTWNGDERASMPRLHRPELQRETSWPWSSFRCVAYLAKQPYQGSFRSHHYYKRWFGAIVQYLFIFTNDHLTFTLYGYICTCYGFVKVSLNQ